MQHNNTRRSTQRHTQCENCKIQQSIESIIVIMVVLLRQIPPLSCSACSKTVNTYYPVHQMASIHVHDTPSVRFAYTHIRCKHSLPKPPGEPSAQIKTPSNVMQHSPASHRYRFSTAHHETAHSERSITNYFVTVLIRHELLKSHNAPAYIKCRDRHGCRHTSSPLDSVTSDSPL